MKKQWKKLMSYVFGAKTWVDDNWCAPDYHVAAGDPALGGMAEDIPGDFPTQLAIENEEISTDHFEKFVVDGFSMVPKGIANGSILLCRRVTEDDLNEVENGKYLLIKVDQDYYDKKAKDVVCKYKLRCSLGEVPLNSNSEDLLNILKETEDSLLLPANQNSFKKKFKEAYQYYDSDRPMLVSITYRDGKIRYSFHPKDLVEFEAKYVVTKEEGDFKSKVV